MTSRFGLVSKKKWTKPLKILLSASLLTSMVVPTFASPVEAATNKTTTDLFDFRVH